MKGCKIVLDLYDGSKVWINIEQIVKMVKTPDGKYYIVLTNGEQYMINHSIASMIENCFQDR